MLGMKLAIILCLFHAPPFNKGITMAFFISVGIIPLAKIWFSNDNSTYLTAPKFLRNSSTEMPSTPGDLLDVKLKRINLRYSEREGRCAELHQGRVKRMN